MVNDRAGMVLDRLRVVFDDERAVANAGLLLPATVASRIEIEAGRSRRRPSRSGW